MKSRISIAIVSVLLLAFTACTEYWDNHYGIFPETVDKNMWEAMQNDPEISEFVKIIKQLQYDTLFSRDNTYTLFIPTNSAIAQYSGKSLADTSIIKYHISTHFIQSGNITGKVKIQTFSKKFALFERTGSSAKLDGIPIKMESPLYRNGKYFLLERVAEPLPNLYEFFGLNNPVLKDYIDLQDSIVLDKAKSKPIGFDEEGNTVYDTVSTIFNKFEARYFPVKHEYRNRTATIVFPLQEDYREALTVMAQKMKIPGYVDYRQIPIDWQNEILVPHLLKYGVFENMLEPEEFVWKSPKDTLKLKNMEGDSVKILYTPDEKAILSNGYAYNYKNFVIPDSLYQGGTRFELEWLLKETGVNKYSWSPLATIRSDASFAPLREYISTASKDSIVRVVFNKGYTGRYSVEFETRKLFPRKYVMVVATHMDIGGIYDIYVNDKLVKTFNYYDYVLYRGIITSVTGARYIAVGRFNKFDMWVDNIANFDKARIRFEYKGPGNVASNGFVIDYVEFIPAN
jgi:uncharacterized surface protein with fasciclin (FAS1) repeats